MISVNYNQSKKLIVKLYNKISIALDKQKKFNRMEKRNNDLYILVKNYSKLTPLYWLSPPPTSFIVIDFGQVYEGEKSIIS